MIGRSLAHTGLLERLASVASTDAEVLINGPSGVGKELYARYLHSASPRRSAPFVAVNCGALSGELLENELFGHIGGAFTGAISQRAGLVAAADGGTLFLDEIDSLSPVNQVKLLRFVQDKEYRRLGEAVVRRANVRFVSATNADLQGAVQAGRFRSDLFFRLRVFPVRVSALHERPEDIEVLVDEFVERYALDYDTDPISFTLSARHALDCYSWPGNIRELENCIRYLTCLRLTRPIETFDLPLLDEIQSGAEPSHLPGTFRTQKRAVVDRFEREFLEKALRRTEGNIARAAQTSGKARRAFFELLRKHSIDPTSFRRRSS